MRKWVRCLFGCTGILWTGVALPLDWLFTVALPGLGRDRSARARLMTRWARFTSGLFHCTVTVEGRPPEQGLCVSNHLGNLDILAIGSVRPFVFVSKADVRRWPLFGQWAAMSGTLFIRREQKGHVADIGDQIADALFSRVPLVLFPEGTSSGGDSVLPFKSSLFQPAVELQWPVTPIWIGYELDDGTVANDVAYWRDMTLVPHLFNLLTKRRIRATIAFGEPLEPGNCRKELCQRAHEAVDGLRKRQRKT